MSILLLSIFGIASGTLFSVLVGIIGSNRKIGFGWSFLLSLIFTPLVGLIFTLISDPLPYGSERRYGCLAPILGIIGFILLIPVLLALLGFGALLLV